MTIIVLCLLLVVLWVGLQCVIVVFPGHTDFLLFFYWSNDDEVQQAALKVLKGGVKNLNRQP